MNEDELPRVVQLTLNDGEVCALEKMLVALICRRQLAQALTDEQRDKTVAIMVEALDHVVGTHSDELLPMVRRLHMVAAQAWPDMISPDLAL